MTIGNNYNNGSDYIRNLLDQQIRWEDQYRSSTVATEMRRLQDLYSSSGVVTEIRKLEDLYRSSSVATKMQRLQDMYSSSGVSTEIQRLQDMYSSSGVATEIRKLEDLYRSSSVATEMQRLQDMYSSSVVSTDIQRLQDMYSSSGVATEIRKLQDLYSSSSVATEMRRLQDLYRSSSIATEIQKMQTDYTSSVITRLSEMAENLRNVSYTVNPDGTITGQNFSINHSEVQTIIESYLETLPEADNIRFEIKIDNILTDIAKRHPVISKFIIIVLLQFFINVFTTVYFSPPLQIDYAHLAKHLKKEIQQKEMSTDFYRHYRFVSSPSLTVWSKNSTRSKYVGKLYFSYLVRVIHKKKNWSLIEYRNKERDVIIQGWVFTRYIKRFN